MDGRCRAFPSDLPAWTAFRRLSKCSRAFDIRAPLSRPRCGRERYKYSMFSCKACLPPLSAVHYEFTLTHAPPSPARSAPSAPPSSASPGVATPRQHKSIILMIKIIKILMFKRRPPRAPRTRTRTRTRARAGRDATACLPEHAFVPACVCVCVCVCACLRAFFRACVRSCMVCACVCACVQARACARACERLSERARKTCTKAGMVCAHAAEKEDWGIAGSR